MQILIPTDFSADSEKAIEFAYTNFGHGSNVKYRLLHCISLPQTGSTILHSLDRELKKVATENMSQFSAELAQKYPRLKIECELVFGDVKTIIKNYTRFQNFDLVVCGTTGSGGYLNKLLGSNATAIIKSSLKPVVVVPGCYESRKINEVIFANDPLSPAMDEKKAKLNKLAQTFGARIQTVSVSKQPQVAAMAVAGNEMEYTTVANPDDSPIEETIIDFALQAGADMIAAVPQHNTFWKQLFHHSVVRGLALHSTLPLLVVK